MNDFLADLMRFGNGVLAIVCILTPAYLFFIGVPGVAQGESISWVLIGLLVGIVFATLTCGTIATFISIRTELVKIRELLESKPSPLKEDFLKDFKR